MLSISACYLCSPSPSRSHSRQISKYEFVVDIPNSMTVLTEMLPIAISMSAKKLVGIYNFTNPGAISHNQILQMYKVRVYRQWLRQ